MRGSIVVLAFAVAPFVARASLAQEQQGHERHWVQSHVVRRELPTARRDDDRDDDKKCEERQRGNPSQHGMDHRADPRTKGNKDCKSDPPPAPQPPPPAPAPAPAPTPAPDTTPTPAPPPPPPPAPAPAGHTIVQGSVFFDLDQNGAFDPSNEVALSGWTVSITGPMNLTATTDGNGAYEFDGLVAGNYTVCVIPPVGWIQTPIAGAPSCGTNLFGYSIQGVQLAGDVVYSGVDFGFISQ